MLNLLKSRIAQCGPFTYLSDRNRPPHPDRYNDGPHGHFHVASPQNGQLTFPEFTEIGRIDFHGINCKNGFKWVIRAFLHHQIWRL